MKKLEVLLMIFSLISILLSGACSENNAPPNKGVSSNTEPGAPKLRVVTSTMQLSTIIEQVGGNHVAVTNIIPPKENPLNYHISEDDIQVLSSADVFFMFDWQSDKFSPLLSHQPQTVKITAVNSWLVPAGQIELTNKIADALSKIDDKNKVIYLNVAKDYKTSIEDKEYSVISNLIKKLPSSTITSQNVICAEPEKDFIEWMGLKVVATYQGSEPVAPDEFQRLVEKGKAEKVVTIVDDLQSGQDTGVALAREIGAHQCLCSSCPGGFDYAWSWADTVDSNISRVLRLSMHC